MNLKFIGIVLAIFFLAMVSVSAADENITNDEILSGDVDDVSSVSSDDDLLGVSVDDDSGEEVLSVSVEDNVSSVSDDDLLGVSVDDDSGEEVLSVSVEDNVSSVSDDDLLGASVEYNVSSYSIDENKLSACAVDSVKQSKSNVEQKISMSLSGQNAVLSSIYDKVYPHDEWKSILLTKFKVKKSWSKYKRDKKIRKYWKKAMKKVKRLVKKYTRKGWTYEGRQWTWQVGRYKVSYQYYLQFSKTEYYDGYGQRIA